jgi:hypothetical protein
MYPRNAASPEPIGIGPVVQISDGAVQTAGVTVRVKAVGVAETDGGGTTAYSTDGVVLYTPTQAETNYTSFVLIAKKTGCIPATVTIVTSESTVSGRVYAGTVGDKTGYSLTQAFPANFASLGINSSGHLLRVVLVDTTSVNSDMRGTDNALLAASYTAAPTAAVVADAVWDEAMADHTTSTSYGGRIIRAANSNVTAQLTGSNHIAADVHAFQADVIDAAAIAADAVTELQAGLATAANLTIVSDRVSYCLTALVGACSDAQTAAETYTLSIGGSTFTVDYSGLDASGNRSTTTLTKV